MNKQEYLNNIVESLPAKPGVYYFLDDRSKILYIGKAKDLKKRVKSYFKNGGDGRPQIPMLLEKTYDIRFLITETEREALILENNLIKENRPYYNICLKDDKTYRSIKIDITEEFPRIQIVRKYQAGEKVVYFGPYCGGEDVRLALREINEVFQICDCSRAQFKRFEKRKKPCLKYQIHQCSAPCAGYISKEEYRNNIQKVILFLKGKNKEILKDFDKKMEKYSAQLKYEKAQQVYCKIQALKNMMEAKSNVSGFHGDSDVIGYYLAPNSVLFQVLIIRGGKIISHDFHIFQDKPGSLSEWLRLFIEQYYDEPFRIPEEIWLPIVPEDKALIEQILSERKEKKCRLEVPKKGNKLKAVELAMKNAVFQFEQHLKNNHHSVRLAEMLSFTLHLSHPVFKIECYDISHSSGKETVGAQVVFDHFKPLKSEYKRYIIKNTEGVDDYQSLYEVLSRRIKRGLKENNVPRFVLIDGGPGHLSVLERVLKEYHLEKEVARAAIAKESHAKSSKDKIYIPGRKNPLSLSNNHPVLLKFMEIRDETHRFAIAFHKQKSLKRIIPGQF